MHLDNLEGIDFNKDRSYENWCKYKRQRNFCVNLLRKTKRNFFKNVNEKKISDNRTFWKEIKPYFNDKGGMSSKITLVERDVFERIIYNKQMAYVKNWLSDYITGFRKSHGSQHCLVKMLEN